MKDHAATLATRGPQAFERALEMRYQVYCLECNYLLREDYPDGLETDEHDEGAAHFYAFDHEEQLVGYVRLVKPCPEARFPFQRHCDVSSGIELPSPYEAAEISRLMVRKDYRRRQGDGLSGVTPEQNAAAFSGDRRHQAPGVLLNLYRQMYQYCVEHKLRFWYAAMEKPLARSLSQLGFGFMPIGPATDYYGPVAPYLADLRGLEVQVGQRDASLLAWLMERASGKPPAAEVDIVASAVPPRSDVIMAPVINDWRRLLGYSAPA